MLLNLNFNVWGWKTKKDFKKKLPEQKKKTYFTSNRKIVFDQTFSSLGCLDSTVQWTVFSTPVSISSRQLRYFTDLSHKIRPKKSEKFNHEFLERFYFSSSSDAIPTFFVDSNNIDSNNVETTNVESDHQDFVDQNFQNSSIDEEDEVVDEKPPHLTDKIPEEVDHFFLLIMSIIIFFMQCGFAFMEAGAVR